MCFREICLVVFQVSKQLHMQHERSLTYRENQQETCKVKADGVSWHDFGRGTYKCRQL